MAFISGFLGLLSAVGGGSATEFTLAGYARQPIAFSTPQNGRCVSARPFMYGVLGTPSASGNTANPIAGYGIYDAPTGGNLLLALACSVPQPLPGNGPLAAEAGHLHLYLAALAQWPDGDAFSGTLAATTVVGTWFNEPAYIATPAPLSTGVALTITRGVLRAT